MIRVTASKGLNSLRLAQSKVRCASNRSLLEGDSGPLSTRIHHTSTLFLGIATPIYMLVPSSKTDTTLNKLFGLVLSANISFHSWVGLNYVAVDYVPKISKALLPPARIAIAGMCLITFAGLTKASFAPGGLKAVIKGPWTAKSEEDSEF